MLAIFGYGLQLNERFKWPLESTLVYVCASLICVLYFSALLGFLYIAGIVSVGLGVLFLLQGAFSRVKNGTIGHCMSPGVLFFVISVAGLWLLMGSEYYSTFVFVDDFSHWGRVSKIIADNGRLIVPTDAVWFQDYPPGMALFNYLFLQFSGFSAKQAMFSQGIFVFAALASLFSAIPKDANRYVPIGVSLFAYLLIYSIGPGLHTLSVDLIVGLVFGIAVFGYLTARQSDRLSSVLRLVPLVMVLPLIKQIGILFSFVVIGIVVVDVLLKPVNMREKIKLTFAALFLLAMCILAHTSWSTHVSNMGVAKTFQAEITPTMVINAFDQASATERQKKTIGNFTNRVFQIHLNYYQKQHFWFIGCLGFIWLISHMKRDSKSNVSLISFLILFGGYFAYLGVLLVLYLFAFGAYEGPRLASFERYMNTYLVGMLIILFGLSLAIFYKERRARWTTIALIILSLLTAQPNLKTAARDVRAIVSGQQNSKTEKVARYSDVINRNSPPESRVFFVWPNSSGSEHTKFSFGILPRKGNRNCWSVGMPYYEGDVWTCRMTDREFEQVLMDYDYLFVAHTDNEFRYRFSTLFGPDGVQDERMFRVLKKNGRVELQIMQVTS